MESIGETHGKNYAKNDKIKVECIPLHEYIETYSETKEPLFTRIPHELQICLGSGYILLEGCCSTCTPVELTLLEIMNRDNVWWI